MALILAIEPDRRQSAQLARLIQARVAGAELVLADTTEQALGAIGNRVPDLVLVPALLAPQDDVTLATALRVIAAAAHVQMLTIPVLAPTRGASEPLGMLARLRRRRTDPVPPDGCDPDVFGDQIAAYLAEAAAERAIKASDLAIELSSDPSRRQDPAPSRRQDDPAPSRRAGPFGPAGEAGSTGPGLHAGANGSTAGELPAVAAERFAVAELVFDQAEHGRAIETTRFMIEEVGNTAPQAGPVEELIAERAIAAADAFTLGEAVVEVAVVEPVLEIANFIVEEVGDTALQTAPVGELIATTIDRELETLVASTTKDTRNTTGDPGIEDVTLPTALETDAVERLTADEAASETFTLVEAVVDEAVLADVELPTALELAATSAELPAVHFDLPKRLKVSAAPWMGPQRRWPDLEGEAAVDSLTVVTAAETADEDVHTPSVLAVVTAAIEDLPTSGPSSLNEDQIAVSLGALDEPVPFVVVEMPVDVQESPQAIDMATFEKPAPAALLELWMPLSFVSTRSWPTLEGVWAEARPDPPAVVHAEPPVVVAAAPPAPAPALAPAPAAAPALAQATAPEWVPAQEVPAARPEWIELIESLRQDVKRLRTERTQTPPAGPRTKEISMPASRPSPALRRATVGGEVELTPKKRATAAKPAQDEWGFFDPEQCGFAALLAKLDEITQVTDGP